MQWLDKRLKFPEISETSHEGIIALGGDLSVERLLLAYRSGIFPWYDRSEPIVWWCPDPRFVLFPSELKVSKSMKQVMRNSNFKMTINQDFQSVIKNCSTISRNGQTSTWITDEMIAAYCKLNELGHAVSVEVWKDEKLVGGLYGIDLKNGVFCGESMFSKVSNASKFGFIKFIQESNYHLIDCQVHTNHLESLGAKEIDRHIFLKFLAE